MEIVSLGVAATTTFLFLKIIKNKNEIDKPSHYYSLEQKKIIFESLVENKYEINESTNIYTFYVLGSKLKITMNGLINMFGHNFRDQISEEIDCRILRRLKSLNKKLFLIKCAKKTSIVSNNKKNKIKLKLIK